MSKFDDYRLRFVDFLKKYEHRISSISLISGFIFDFLTLWRIDLFLEDLIFIAYLSVAAICISYLTFAEGKPTRGKWSERFYLLCVFALQFVFGGLFGRFFIYYSRSGSLATSWPFLIFIASFFVVNERMRKNYKLYVYRTSVFFVALFSFAIFYVPIIFDEISTRMFLLSGGSALVVIALFLLATGPYLKSRTQKGVRLTWLCILAAYGLINAAYFSNILPPIPLSMERSAVFHLINRQGNNVVGYGEDYLWYNFLQVYRPVHLIAGEPVYVYASIFAPTNVKTTVWHTWWHYDNNKKAWQKIFSVPISMVGGRNGGWRGYSYTQHAPAGLWRVDIGNSRGQIIGVVKFNVENVGVEPSLVQETI